MTHIWTKKYSGLSQSEITHLDSAIPKYGNKILNSTKVMSQIFSDNYKLQFADDGTYYPDNIGYLSRNKLIKKYSVVGKKKNSFQASIGAKGEVLLSGCEAKTKVKNKNGYSVNNHIYTYKIEFTDAKRTIKKGILLVEDVHNTLRKYCGKILGFEAMLIGAPLLLDGENSDAMQNFYKAIYQNLYTISPYLVPTLLIGLYFIIYYGYKFFDNKRRVKLESIKFEKEFDMYSDNKIDTRILFSPSFIPKLLQFVNNISHKRKYRLFFKGNSVYIVHNLIADYRWIDPVLFSQKQDYLEFYLEIKYIQQLVKQLEKYYYHV